jgi:hypothetical protein
MKQSIEQEHWQGKTKVLRGNLSHQYTVNFNSHVVYPMTEPGPLHLEADEQLPQLYSDTLLLSHTSLWHST